MFNIFAVFSFVILGEREQKQQQKKQTFFNSSEIPPSPLQTQHEYRTATNNICLIATNSALTRSI